MPGSPNAYNAFSMSQSYAKKLFSVGQVVDTGLVTTYTRRTCNKCRGRIVLTDFRVNKLYKLKLWANYQPAHANIASAASHEAQTPFP